MDERWAAILYRDEPDNAAVERDGLGLFTTRAAAVGAIRSAITSRGGGWHCGTVHVGWLYPAVYGRRPERFESDESRVGGGGTVGPDWDES